LTLKDDALDFLEEKTLRKLVGKYSEFINFPIYLWSTKEQEKEIVEPLVAEEEKEPKSDVEDVTEEVKKDDAAPVEKEMEMVSDWELLNTNKPIWTRNPSEIDEDEYHDFYKGLFKETMLPMAFSHFKAEGDTEFKSIVFIPHTAPKGFMEGSTGDSDLTKNVKMFVRRVFITEELPNFLPRWLAFMKVMVDSNDLPLSVSRDTLQNHPKIVTIRKKVIGKCLDLIISLEDEKSKVTTDTSLFETFFKQFKIALKYGLYDSKISSHSK
jgi:heat shock protein beta